MFKLEFGIVHRGCLVNELSRAVPKIRFICPGGFILGPSSTEEILAIDKPDEGDVQAVMGYLKGSPGIAEAEVVERTPDKAFIRILTSANPEGFCSEAVARNRCFRIGMEIQHGGVERWAVGSFERAQAEQLLKDLAGLGELKYHSISEVSWQALLEGQAP